MSDANAGCAGQDSPPERLISEPVTPVSGSFDAVAMAGGSPGIPKEFDWRGKRYRVEKILGERKTLRGCHHGSGEQYIDKHFYEIETDSGESMTLYRTRSGSKKDSWILYTMKRRDKIRIAVLVSGGGTNLQALIDATEASGGIPFEIALVVADRECFASERAKKHGIRAECANAPAGLTRTEARRVISDRVLELVREARADAIVLAGFLTIMSGAVIDEYAGRIVNLHPALLPKFGGKGMWGHHVHEAVLAAGETESGCTIHLVDSGCDTGKILLQKKVPVLPGDTAESLAARISSVEHEAIVEGVVELARQIKDAPRE